MKLNFKPWQIVVSAVAGIAVVGASATGIWYGVSHSNGEPNNDPAVALVETATATEQALDEPSAAAPESTEEETEATTKKQTTKESTSESVTPSTEEKITFEYDPVLSREVALLLQDKFPDSIYDDTLILEDAHPEHLVYDSGKINTSNSARIYRDSVNEITADSIISAWTWCTIFPKWRFNIQAYRYFPPYENYVYVVVVY